MGFTSWRDLHVHEGADADLVRKSRDAYSEAQLPLSVKKRFSFAPNFVAWSTEVLNKSGSVGVETSKRLQLMCLGLIYSIQRRVSNNHMQKLLGSFIHPFCHRRELMSLFAKSFLWVSNLKDFGSHLVPSYVREELLMASLHLLVAVSDVRAPISTTISCSDATPNSAGTVEAMVSNELADSLYSHAEHRGFYSRLDWSDTQWSLRSAVGIHPTDAILDSLKGVPWVTKRSFSFSGSDHVNIQELRAMKCVLKDSVSRTLKSQRLVNGIDSRVVLGCLGKGRPSSSKLNAVARSCIGWAVLGRTRLVIFWLSSGDNFSDEPSRFKVLRARVFMPEVPRRLFVPERTPCRTACRGARGSPKIRLEVFAGCGRLSVALEAAGMQTGPPLDAYPKWRKGQEKAHLSGRP